MNTPIPLPYVRANSKPIRGMRYAYGRKLLREWERLYGMRRLWSHDLAGERLAHTPNGAWTAFDTSWGILELESTQTGIL